MILKQEEIKLKALRALEEALRSRDIEELQAAIRQGQSSNLEPSHLRQARAALDEEQKKLAARSQLEKAIKRRDINALLKALGEGEKAGLVPEAEERCLLLLMESWRCFRRKLVSLRREDLIFSMI